ncbi:MAG: AAA family ATPase [Candidatus Azambacteria bacterium]|nr:AAA family ATPase [Candidatus Azambacteria bacterium]
MRLKKLDRSGFKSFAHKTALEFPTAVSAIVGPNGSGKSNVVDSVRWVLGEQGFKNLRSKSGADLIWAGSAAKPSQGKASVSLHFDNRDGFFPVDFDEVVIGRKVYRDGANEYYLNDSQVRLKDITELLARSKLGLRGNSIVNQGSADEILKADPAERQGILEEALGLREFQLKKSEAESKLSETGANLEQTANLINEISPRLRSLKRQVEKFQKREILVTDLNNLENEFFKIKIREIYSQRNDNQKAREEVDARITTAKENFETNEKLFEEQITKFSKAGEKNGQFETSLEKLNTERHDITRELGRIEGIIESAKRNNAKNIKTLEAVLAIKIKYWAKRLDAVSQLADAVAIKETIKNLAGEIGTVSDCLEKNDISKILSLVDLADIEEKNESPYEKDKENFKLKFARIDEQINQNKKALSKIRSEEMEWRGKYSVFQKDLEMARREYMLAQEAAQRFNLEEEKIKLKEADLKSELWGSGKDYEELTATFATADTKFVLPETEYLSGLENKIIKLRREIAEIGGFDEEIMREYEETDKRHVFLTTEFSDLTSAVGSLKSLIENLTGRINSDFKMGLAKINDEFEHYFKLMFGGGSAKLENESGVTINVNVPRKRIRDLAALSGGERALISIALLFAIVSVSRPPFLVLDEIDAALDEANAAQFAKVLKDLAEKTQFVLITHNRSTMEIANVLYGVTMGDDGVSKLFSLKLEDAVV